MLGFCLTSGVVFFCSCVRPNADVLCFIVVYLSVHLGRATNFLLGFAVVASLGEYQSGRILRWEETSSSTQFCADWYIPWRVYVHMYIYIRLYV